MLPDLRTLILVLAITTSISALALFLFYRLLKEINGLKYAAIGGGFQAAASCFLLIRPSLEPLLAIMLSNVSYFLSLLFYYQAARLLTGLRAAWGFPLAIVFVLSPMLVFFQGNEFLAERIIIASLGLGAFGMMSSYVLWKNAAQLPGRIGLSLTFLLLGLISLWRIFSMLTEPTEGVGFLDFNADYMIFIWGIVNSIIMTIGFIVLASEKLQQQLRLKVEQLSYARDIANKSLQAQQHFFSMLSHEFKAPIGTIRANADAALLLDESPVPVVQESLNRIKNVSERLTTLVDRCMSDEWVAYAIENTETELEPVALLPIIRDVCEEFSVKFNVSFSSNAMVKGEPVLLAVLFSNLVANACRHAKHIESVKVDLLASENHYLIKVTDDGEGIPEQQRQQIFEKYYRIDSNSSDGGSGLGLYFAKKICDIHRAGISVECEEFTVFTVEIPKSEIAYD